MHLQDLRLWTRRMEAMTVSERADLPGVSKARAEQMLAGAIAAEAAMEAFGIETMRVCPWALREGLILKRIGAPGGGYGYSGQPEDPPGRVEHDDEPRRLVRNGNRPAGVNTYNEK